MSKRDYTHVRLLYPEIKAMIEAGKTQREIADDILNTYSGMTNV